MTKTGTKLLLTTVCKPYGVSDGDAEAVGMQMELMNNQITREQDVHSPRATFWTFPLYFLAENVSVPTTILDFPSWRAFRKEMKKGYTHVGISFIQTNVMKAKRMAEFIRREYPDVKIIVGGYGAILPDIRELVPCDEVCKGEGIRWLREYFGEPTDTPVRHPVMCGVAARHFYGFKSSTVDSAVIFPGLGCKNACFFCSTSHKYDHQYIPLLATGDEVFEACRRAEDELGVHEFVVIDENFLKEPTRAKRLLELMELHKKAYRFSIFGSAEILNEFGMDFLVRMGVTLVWVGIESEKPLFDKLSGYDARTLIRDLQANGISVISSSILFLEHHDQAILDKEIDWAISMESDLHQFMQLTPLPGTPLFDRYKSEGRLIPNFPYTKMSGQNVLNFYHENFESEEARELTREAFRRKYEAHGSSMLNVALTSLRGYHVAVKKLEQSRASGMSWDPATLAYNHRNGSTPDEYLAIRIEEIRQRCKFLWPVIPVSELFAPNSHCRHRAREVAKMYRLAFGRPTAWTWLQSLVVGTSGAIETLRIYARKAFGRGELVRQPPSRRMEYRMPAAV